MKLRVMNGSIPSATPARRKQVRVVVPDHNQVVRIMRNGGRNRSVSQPIPLDQPNTNITGRMVALDHRDFAQSARSDLFVHCI